jgi:hypothetical protein
MPSRLLALVVACTLGFIAIPGVATASPLYGSDGGSFSGWFGHDLVPGSPPGGTPFALWFSLGTPAPAPDPGPSPGDTSGTPGTPGQQDTGPTTFTSGLVVTCLCGNDSSFAVVDTLVTGVTTIDVAPAVPETSTWAMMLIGLATLGIVARRRRLLSAAA